MNYRVIWEIDIEADTPRGAATEAWSHLRAEHTTATVFEVRDEAGENTQVDLGDQITTAPRTDGTSPYREMISELAPAYDPRHVEAYMRVEHPTLDGLAYWQFAEEVKLAAACIEAAGLKTAERVAISFGL